MDLTYNLLKACPRLIHQKLLDPNEMKYSPEFFTGYASSTTAPEALLQRHPEAASLVQAAAVVDWDNVEYVYSTDEDGEGEDEESYEQCCIDSRSLDDGESE